MSFLSSLKHIWINRCVARCVPALLLCKHLVLITEESTTRKCQHWHSGRTHAIRCGRCADVLFRIVEELKVTMKKHTTKEKKICWLSLKSMWRHRTQCTLGKAETKCSGQPRGCMKNKSWHEIQTCVCLKWIYVQLQSTDIPPKVSSITSCWYSGLLRDIFECSTERLGKL